MFVKLSDGNVRNAYTVKVLNKSGEKREIAIGIEGIVGGQMSAETGRIVEGRLLVDAEPNKVSSQRIFVIAEPQKQNGKSIKVRVVATDTKTGNRATSKSVFIRGRE
ncbi:MAG: polyferredoxin [Hyphomonadaceae bacterium]|nr:MAG: polyferredoxin [Hyphomonadaceae bacterium]